MDCPSCREFVRASTAVCPYCGARVPIVDAPPKLIPLSSQPAPQKVDALPKQMSVSPQPAPQKNVNVVPKLIECPNCGEETPTDSIKCRVCSHILSKSNNVKTRFRNDTANISGPTLICTKCGFSNIPEKKSCKSCGSPLYSEETPLPQTNFSTDHVSLEERMSALEQEIVRQVRAGWLLITRTDTSAQMVSGRSGMLTSLLKRSESLYIEVDKFGNIRHTKV